MQSINIPGGSGSQRLPCLREPRFDPGSEKIPEGNGSLRYSLENPDGETWWATVHGSLKSGLDRNLHGGFPS